MARPRKPGNREPNGRLQRAREEIHPEAIAARERELSQIGVSTEHAKDALAGFCLGQLRLRGRSGKPNGITEEQYQAGESWSRRVRAYQSINGTRGGVKSPGFVMVANGLDTKPDREPDEIQKIREGFVKSYNLLAKAAKRYGVRVMTVTWSVCMENPHAGTLSPDEIKYLRAGLDALSGI